MVKLFLFFLFFLFSTVLKSQNIFYDEINLLNNNRDKQLIDSNYMNLGSLLIRSTSIFQNKSNNKFNILYSYDHVDNSLLPGNWNDGIMFPSRGKQERHSLGLHINSGIIDFNFQPEWLKVENIPQEKYIGNPEDGNFMSKYFGSVANVIDNYRNFGTKKIDTFSFGQSRIGIRTKKIQFGYSLENIWWGPGIRNSIVMTNNAAGFKHFYLTTHKPIKTFIGDFEFSLITGILDTNWYEDPDLPLMKSIWTGGIAKKNLDKRAIDALTVIYNSKYLPNLFVGFAYSRQYYKNQQNEYNQKYSFFSKDRVKQEIGSLFFRYMLPKDFSEFYVELGIPNNSPYPWKYFQKNSKIGLVAGITLTAKLTKNYNSYLRFNTEITQLQLYNPKDIFYPGWAFVGGLYNSWYTNYNIKQGYTNQGQLLGAPIGPGSNMQSINFSYHNKFSTVGLQVERIEHNKDFFYIVYFNGKFGQANNNGIFQWGYYNKYWVDINTKIYAQLSLNKNLMIAASFMKTNASNYRWLKFPEIGKKYDEGSKITDKINFQFQLSLKFLLNAKIQKVIY